MSFEIALGRWTGPVRTLGCLLDGFQDVIGGKVVDINFDPA